MATTTTYKKRTRIPSRLRAGTTDIEEISTLGLDNLAEDVWGAVSEQNCVIGGLEIEHTSGTTFQVNGGACVINGQIYKLPTGGITIGSQDAIVDPGHERIDLVYIDTTDPYTDLATDSLTKTVLSALSATPISSEAVGTGDSSTKTWDLANPGVDPSTLIVNVDGSQEHGGYDFSQGTGAGLVDQIIFATAPTTGVAITADYTHYSGGSESSTSENTRYARVPKFAVRKGTEAVSAGEPALGANELFIGYIYYPQGWTTGDPTGATSGAFIYDDKVFLVARDAANENSYGSSWGGSETQPHSPFDQMARVSDAIRNIGQVRHGCRLRYDTSTNVKVGPGWLVSNGLSCRVTADITHTVTAASGAGWYYLYAKAAVPSGGAGIAPTIIESTAPPNSLGQESSVPLSDAGTLYLGAVYVVSTGPVVIREFHTDGDGWTWWDDAPTDISVPSSVATIDVSAWCPESAKKLWVEVLMSFNASTGGDNASTFVQSNQQGGSLGSYPEVAIQYDAVGSGTYNRKRAGIVRAENDSGTMKIRGYTTASAGTNTSNVRVCGFYEDPSMLDVDAAGLSY